MTPPVEKGSSGFDLGQHLFDTITSMNRVRMMELGITPPAKEAPRERALYVRDDHVQALLIAMTDHLIRQRQLKVDPTLAEVEMLGVLTDLVQS